MNRLAYITDSERSSVVASPAADFVIEKLSSADSNNSAIANIFTWNSRTILHTVPSGEIHEVHLRFGNTHSSVSQDLYVTIGETLDVHRADPQTEQVEVDDKEFVVLLVGPTEVRAGATPNATSIKVYGYVKNWS